MSFPRLRSLLSRIAPVYPGEGASVLLCLAVNFLVVAGIMFGRNARDSLFLVYVGAEYLPYMYFANAAFLVFTSLLYTLALDQLDRGRLLGSLSLLFVASLVLSRVILLQHPRWFFPVLYIQSQVIWYFSLMQFWTFVGDLFDTRQAKRLYPLLAVGALLGMISVGLTSRTLVRAVGSENLFLVWGGLILAASLLGAVIYRRYRTAARASNDASVLAARNGASEWQKIKGGLREVGREPLLRSMAGYVLLLWTVYAIVDFCFNKTMHDRYPDPNELTMFFGRFIGLQGFFCLLVQLLLTRAIIAWLGVGTTINFHPAFLVLGTAWMSLRYGYPSVLATKLGDATLLYTFSDSSYQLLYNPLPPERRPRVRGFIEGYIRPLSLAAAGVLVLLGTRYLVPLHFSPVGVVSTTQQLSWIAFGLAAVWLAFALTAKKGYIRALLRSLRGDSPSLRQAAETALGKLKDPASLSILSETLRSENPARVIGAVQFLETVGTHQAKEAVAALLTHPDAGVRATVVSALGRLGGGEFAERLVPLLEDPHPRVRANSIEALARSRDPAFVDKLRPLLQDTSIRTRVNALLAIAAIQGPESAREWLPLIRELAHGDRAARSTAVYALGRLPLDESMDLLSELLKDSDLQLRCEAAEALGRIGAPRVIPGLIEALAGPAELRHAVRRSLAAIVQKHGPEPTHLVMRGALASERPEIRSELADVLGRLRNPEVIGTLIALLKDPEWRVRWKVLKSFARLTRAGPLPQSARVALFDYAREELANFRRSLSWSQALLPSPEDEAERVLARALEEDRAKIEERVFNMLGIICGRDRMLAIYQKLNSDDARLKSDALEALDTLAPRPVAREVLDLLELRPQIKVGPAAPGLLATLTNHPKPWIRTCALYYLGYHPHRDGEALVKARLADPDPAVRETALYAGGLAFNQAWRAEVQAALSAPDPFLRRVARRISTYDGTSAAQIPPGVKEPMLLTVEKVLFLKSAPLFASLDSEELAALAEIAVEQEYALGEVIFQRGQVAHHLYVIVRGRVEVLFGAKERPVAVLGEKECFGEMAILDDHVRSATTRAAEPTLVLKIDHDSFRELILERPQISFAIFQILSGRLRQKNLETENLLGLDMSRHGV